MGLIDRYQETEFGLEALVDVSTRLLRRLGVRVEDGRVSEAPDGRTLRYYQTTGLLDKPLRYEGRKAVYGYRHLLQVLCVKALQEEGHPLGLVQGAVAGRTTQQLEACLEMLRSETRREPLAKPRTQPTLIAAEVHAGITVIIDPRRVANPQATLARLAESLATFKEKAR